MSSSQPSVAKQDSRLTIEDLPAEFWERTDKVIAQANEFAQSASTGEASLCLLYAAARYNAFEVATSAGSSGNTQTAKAEAIQHFLDQYRQMLEANLEDYIANYTNYL